MLLIMVIRKRVVCSELLRFQVAMLLIMVIPKGFLYAVNDVVFARNK